MIKVCILAPVHYYKDIRVFQKEARSLARYDYQVVLISRIEVSKTVEGIRVLNSLSNRSRIQRFIVQPILLIKSLRTKSDIYHLHNPDTLLIGFLLKLFGKKVIYDTHEDFSKRILMKHWIKPRFRKIAAKSVELLERLAVKYLDAVIVTQPDLKKKFGVKATIIENAPLAYDSLIQKSYSLSEAFKKESNSFRLIYVGGISNTRGIVEMIQALEKVNEKMNCRLWLIGPFAEERFYYKLKSMPGWKFVDYLGELPQEEAFAYMIVSDIGMVTILDVGDHSNTSANKLYEYQRFALPFIASNFKKWVNELSNVKSGVFVDPQDIRRLVTGILNLLDDPDTRKLMGRNGQNYIINKFNWANEEKKLIALYKQIHK